MGPASDPNVASAILEVGPSREVRPNPTPKAKYDLVVIGAGVAGLLRCECISSSSSSEELHELKTRQREGRTIVHLRVKK